ncbi:MAG: cation diffusion facilitator family transporter [Terriglobia bacterium]
MSCSHPHSHDGHRQNQHSSLKIALILTGVFMVLEFLGGLYTNSLALLADAGHMLTDVAALGLSLFAMRFSSRPATAAKTYGFYRVEILAALLNGATLVLISVMIVYKAYFRLLAPPKIESEWMLVVAVSGLMVNLACAYFLHQSEASSLNIRGAFLHVLGDALGSVAAIIAGLLMLTKGWYLADPVISILVAILILYSSWLLLRDSVDILLEGTPVHISLQKIREALCQVEGVESVHDLHVWTLTSGLHAMSCHAVLCGNPDHHQVLEKLSHIVRKEFEIEHTTIQLEEVSLQHQELNRCH